MTGTKKAGVVTRKRKKVGREERREENREESAAAARPKYILENSCYSLSGVLEEQTEQSVLFFAPHESVFSDGLQDTQASLRLQHRLGISFNQPQ